jgi:fengycin family lipopeptide synthetase D
MEIQEKMLSGEQEELPPVEVDFDGRKQKYEKLVSRTEASTLETYRPERVFITGGTGFFGSYLLASMLQHTDAHLFCLVRGENDAVAAERLRKRIDTYFGEGFYHRYSDRLTVFKGDITEPYLGIGGKTFRELIGTIDTVHHPAADVRHFGFFEQSDKVNYEGTVNVFDFARFIGASYFNYYSTLDFAGHHVPGVKGMDVYETDLDIGQDFNREIYATTKYKAEKFVSDNATDDMGVKIIRLGNLTGHYETGHFQENISENFIYMLIKTFCDLPVLGRGMERIGIEMSPINWSADAAVKLSTIKHTGLLKLHNIHYQAMSTGLIAEAFGKLGINVEQKDYNEFVDELTEKQNTEGGNVLTGSRVMEFGFMNGAARTNYNYRCDMTGMLRSKLGEEWKELDVDYLVRIIRYGAEKGFFPIDEEKMATA